MTPGESFGKGMALVLARLRAGLFICYRMRAVIHLESLCAVTALGSRVPVRWQRAPCSPDLQICMPPTCHH